MVPVPDSIYFPPLEKCLSGEQLLISWKTIFTSLDDYQCSHESNMILQSFLSDPYVLQLLSKPFDPYSFKATLTKSAFETKTSAINVTPTTKTSYSIAEIKDDSLWLSKEAEIDEVSALRIVVLEYQTRSAAQLQAEFSEEEAASLMGVAGNINTDSSSQVSWVLRSKATTSNASFESHQSRRIRALRIYLSERRHLLKCAETLLHIALRSAADQDPGKAKALAHGSSWTKSSANLLLTILSKSDNGVEDFLIYCIKAFKANIENLGKGSGWFKSEAIPDDLELDWLGSHLAEAIHTLETILLLLDYRKNVRPSGTVLEWFRCVSKNRFFAGVEAPDPSMQTSVSSLLSLAIVVSLSMLNPSLAISCINEPNPDVDSAHFGQSTSYISDADAVEEIHGILLNAAKETLFFAGPTVLAWATILAEVRDSCIARTEAREERQRAIEALEDDIYDERHNEEGGQAALQPHASIGLTASDDDSINQEILGMIMDTDLDQDPIEYLAEVAVEGSQTLVTLTNISLYYGTSSGMDLDAILCARIRLVILDIIRCSIGFLGYIPEVITAALATLTGGQQYFDVLGPQPLDADDSPITTFVQDQYMLKLLLDPARSRYPYESLPFLQLLRAIATCQRLDDDGNLVARVTLQSMGSFTHMLPFDFRGYETTQEEDNANSIQLTRNFMLFEPRSNKRVAHGRASVNEWSNGLMQLDQFCIPAGVSGRIVSEEGPKIAVWFHEYSGLKYLGKLLETAITAGDYVDATTGQEVDRENLIEMVGLLATLVSTSTKSASSHSPAESNGTAYQILEEVSDGLDRSRDVISVIFSIFDEELQRQSVGAAAESSLELLIACVQFLHSIVPVLPGRVWPLLSRCGLLDSDGHTGRMSTIIAGVELISTRYDFLCSCVHLFDALIEDTATHAILRRIGTKASMRFDNAEDLGTGVPDHILSQVLLSYTATLTTVYESACNWKFAIPRQRLVLAKLIPAAFDKILHYTYGVGEGAAEGAKITRSLGSAAHHIIETFLSPASGLLRFQPVLRALVDGTNTPSSTVALQETKLWISQVKVTLLFTKTLIRIRTSLKRPSSQLEHQTFQASPLVARLYAVDESYQPIVISLLETLVKSASLSAGEPPSLLGHLGHQTSKNFLQMLMDLGKPIDIDSRVLPIWHLLSAVVSNRQQWFAIYLLTGKKPRESLESNKSSPATALTSRPLLHVATDSLEQLQIDAPPASLPRSLAMLKFISLSQNFWPWAMSDLQKNTAFISKISAYISELKAVGASAAPHRLTEGSYQIRMAACIAEILAMYLFHSRQTGNRTLAKELLPSLSFFTNAAVAKPSYNKSLHGNLRSNFEIRFNGCTLLDFRRTDLETRNYGRDYFYDIPLADKMLSFDQAWKGKKNDGLAEELARANVNLSLVDAQIALLHGWNILAVELSSSLSRDTAFQMVMAHTVSDCLVANSGDQLPDNVFAQLIKTRADLALILLQRLIESNTVTPEVKKLLPSVWNTIRSLDTPFEEALTSNDANYYRSLLKMLFLSIRANSGGLKSENGSNGKATNSSQASPSLLEAASIAVRTALEVIEHIVARGFSGLAATIHEQPTEIFTEDMSLVTAILQACLRIPGVEFYHNHIISSIAASDTARAATTIFSWSDKLAINGDPIYGELSILFILELSSITTMAEQLAVDGILGHLSAASLTNYMRRNNVSPFADGAGMQRCHSIWARGILPLLLNLLDAVGNSIAAEVAIFLNQFPNLLIQSVEASAPPDSLRASTSGPERHIAYSTLIELHSLSLIMFILSDFRQSTSGMNDIPMISWDSGAVLENIDFWLGNRTLLRDRIVPMGQREADMVKKKPLDETGGSKNRLEEKMVHEMLGIREVLTSGDV